MNSNSNDKTNSNIEPDEEMLKNLDLLINYEMIKNEDQWGLSEDIETLEKVQEDDELKNHPAEEK